ncbi:Protein CBG26389 [Caenorhabditis briggsae]|uniref:Protein CBG26389 n=1 Tax=Caenorhabditis briggsae TaxID=6238 RepID=B6IFE8_CAEBR|nr:Protein CBG26389 [Caenorhabditis briggsae]CAR98628.1 Protein CBG26389 [Caenorhabditis briggsae]
MDPNSSTPFSSPSILLCSSASWRKSSHTSIYISISRRPKFPSPVAVDPEHHDKNELYMYVFRLSWATWVTHAPTEKRAEPRVMNFQKKEMRYALSSLPSLPESQPEMLLICDCCIMVLVRTFQNEKLCYR